MEGLIFGLVVLSIAVTCERGVLARNATRHRIDEQAFRFHGLRDRLQTFVAEGRLAPTSLTCDFLMRMINFAIRNAGVIRLRDLVEMASDVEKEVKETRFEAICADIQQHDSDVQQLAAEFFLTFTSVLVSNDWLVRAGFAMKMYVAGSWDLLQPIMKGLDGFAQGCLGVINPTRAEAVAHARRYSEWGHKLATC